MAACGGAQYRTPTLPRTLLKSAQDQDVSCKDNLLDDSLPYPVTPRIKRPECGNYVLWYEASQRRWRIQVAENLVTLSVGGTEPYHDMTSFFIDLLHMTHLTVSLLYVVLLDAQGIYPEVADAFVTVLIQER